MARTGIKGRDTEPSAGALLDLRDQAFRIVAGESASESRSQRQ
jgi:hypothetical protein